MKELAHYLKSLPPGTVTDVNRLAGLLAGCWGRFEGSSAEGMAPYKLRRMEDVAWHPPVLSFVIERHGAAALGSTRAELQGWAVNIESLSASCGTAGRRQIRAMQPRLNVKPMAEDIAAAIMNRQEDMRLRWYTDGSVRVLLGEILPAYSAVAQTLRGRRKRFRGELDHLMTERGWSAIGPDRYAPPGRQLTTG